MWSPKGEQCGQSVESRPLLPLIGWEESSIAGVSYCYYWGRRPVVEDRASASQWVEDSFEWVQSMREERDG